MPSRAVETTIHIQSDGIWTNQEEPIINEHILFFFKKNLQRDDKGIYIHNEYGSFEEKAYIQVEGPVMKVVKVWDHQLILETGDVIEEENSRIVVNPENRFFLNIPKLGLWSIFSRQAIIDISPELVENTQGLFWKKRQVEKLGNLAWIMEPTL
jgi:hypothetical protein